MASIWVVIAPGFPPASLGGAEIHADRVARALERRGLQVVRVGARRPPSHPLPWRRAVVHLHLASDTLTPWVKVLRGRYPMLLTLHDAYLACPQLFYARAVGQPCTARDAQHCPVCMHRRAWTARFWYPFRRFGREPTPSMRRWKTYRQALADLPTRGVRWIFPSRYVEQRFREAVSGTAAGVVLPNFPGVPPARNTPAAPRVWGWMGSLSPGKGVELLLEAWARCGRRMIPEAELHLWGAPAPGQAAWWQVLWGRYRRTPGVFWHGPFDPTDTEKVMRTVDAVVLPSLVAENCPLTVVDALAMGRWVLASDRGGLPDLLPEAYRFEPEVDGLCEAWERIRRLPPPPWPAQIPSDAQYVERLLALAEEVMREHA